MRTRAPILGALIVTGVLGCVPDLVPTGAGGGGTGAMSSGSAGGAADGCSDCGAGKACLCALGHACSSIDDCVAGGCVDGRCQTQPVGVWTKDTNPTQPSPRFWHSLAFDAVHGVLFVIGGRNGENPYLVDDPMYSFDGQTWTPASPSGLDVEWRIAATAIFDGQQVFTFGGQLETDKSSETWMFDTVASWTEIHPTHRPPKRTNASSAYDITHDLWVMLGGYNGSGVPIGDVWGFATRGSKDWSQLDEGPSARAEAAMVYDALRSRVVLFGGSEDEIYGYGLDDTWLFDGATRKWTRALVPLRPPRRKAPAAAYDPRRGRMVIFGGLSGPFPGIGRSDTWEWNGSEWMRTATSGPSPRGRAMMVFDSVRGRMVMFGGAATLEPPTALGETWFYSAYGNACAADTDCDGEYRCTDGVCCSDGVKGSCGSCRACNRPESPGVCSALPAGAKDASCASNACDGAGACK